MTVQAPKFSAHLQKHQDIVNKLVSKIFLNSAFTIEDRFQNPEAFNNKFELVLER